MLADFLSWGLVMAMPGPDIISIGMQTARYGQRAGFWTALGAALGVAVWSVLSLLGIEALFNAVPMLRDVLPLIGCAVLVVLGVLALRSAARPAPGRNDQSAKVQHSKSGTWFRSLRLGFVTNISNPKALVFFTSFFTPMMSKYYGFDHKLLALSMLLLITLLVFCVMSVLLKVAADSPIARIPAIRYIPGVIFIGIGVYYFTQFVTMV